jgi:hypothetical protein
MRLSEKNEIYNCIYNEILEISLVEIALIAQLLEIQISILGYPRK